jgi:uncharacterized protein
MTTDATIDYEGLAQEAMRGVVRTVLTQTVKSGLTGDHHFYISFDTEIPGVSLSKRLKEKYPREMTIVLQHRFWDLAVTDERFEVKLTFDGIPERLVVPFAAIKVFFDPSVRYGLQFEDPTIGPDSTAQSQSTSAMESTVPAGAARSQPRRAGRPQRRPRADQKPGNETAAPPKIASSTSSPTPIKTIAPATVTASAEDSDTPADTEATPAEEEAVDAKPTNGGGAEIVSLDKFRKK